jgi:5-methyltetrahydrofolate--homocysteine methyltransferase
MTDDYQDIDLNSLSDDELVEQMHNDLYDGMKDEIVEGTNILLGRGFSATQVLDDALVAGMKIVGSTSATASCSSRGPPRGQRDEGRHGDPPPAACRDRRRAVGKVVIGTVKGDIHDIGKNLVGMMLEGAGFEVIDLGINTDADKFLNALTEHKPDILGMSALLTTTMPYMKVVIQTLKDREMRDDYIVLVGGAPLNEEFGMAVGADAYCRDAGVAAGDGTPPHRRATVACQRPGLTPPERPSRASWSSAAGRSPANSSR